jgi:dipeptidyl-peptidase-4
MNQVTHGNGQSRASSDRSEGKLIYYSSTQASPLQRQLYSVRFDGSGARAITNAAGRHQFDMSPNGQFFIDRWSSTRQTEASRDVVDFAGKLRTLVDNAQSRAGSPRTVFSGRALSFKTTDGCR